MSLGDEKVKDRYKIGKVTASGVQLVKVEILCGGCGSKTKETDNFCQMCGITLKIEEPAEKSIDLQNSCEKYSSDCEDCYHCLGLERHNPVNIYMPSLKTLREREDYESY